MKNYYTCQNCGTKYLYNWNSIKVYRESGSNIEYMLCPKDGGLALRERNEYTAYSFSSDGVDRFTTVYPNENLLMGTKGSYTKEKVAGNSSISEVFLPMVEDIRDYAGKMVSVSMKVKITNANLRTGGGTTRVGWETVFKTSRGTHIYVGVWKILSEGENFEGYVSNTVYIPNDVIGATTPGAKYMQANGDYLEISECKLENAVTRTIYTPSPHEDFENAWPKYIGKYVSIGDAGQSLNPKDYKWGIIRGTKDIEKEGF